MTAVEILIDNLPERFKNAIINTCVEEIEQAKQIEQDQIAIAYETGWVNGDLKKSPSRGSDYYSKTYGK